MVPSFPEIVYEELARPDHVEAYRGIGSMIEEALTREHTNHYSISDSGHCQRKVWAKTRGLFDLPEMAEGLWSRLDLGTIIGVYQAHIFKRGAERLGYKVVLEASVDIGGVTGHIDILLPEIQHIKEVKSHYGTSYYKPKPIHYLQLGNYVRSQVLENIGDWTGSIVHVYPALFESKGPRIVEEIIEADEMLGHMQDAYQDQQRLLQAVASPTMPEPDVDPADTWMCRSACRFSGCEKNKHPSLSR